jgi:nickel-dependent lactate racemase
MVMGKGYRERNLSEQEVRDVVEKGLEGLAPEGKRILVIIPDLTRTAPIPLFFRLFHELIGPSTSSGCQAAALDYLVALGTHPYLSEEELNRRVGITAEERREKYAEVNVFNHEWRDPQTFRVIGTIPAAEIEAITAGLMSEDVEVKINKCLFAYDQLIICGPVFPHEVVGFSGGNKYFFPGIATGEIINFTHWLGAVITSMEIMGHKQTPVRKVIDRAASFIDVPTTCFAFVVKEKELAGLYFGTAEEAWSAAADLSSELHIRYLDHPFEQVLSVMPEMYDDLWTGAKGMYKVEPVVADGGEVIIYAPHITEVSYTWGEIIDRIGYHVRDYFLAQMERFEGLPRGVMAHSTHLRGVGTYAPQTGMERPRIKVTLATGIPEERCRRINLGYRDPDTIHPEEWANREDESILLVRKAGETLYRLKSARHPSGSI